MLHLKTLFAWMVVGALGNFALGNFAVGSFTVGNIAVRIFHEKEISP